MGFQFNHVGGGTKTRRPITLHMKYNSGCVQPTCYLMLEDVGEQEVSLEELQVSLLTFHQHYCRSLGSTAYPCYKRIRALLTVRLCLTDLSILLLLLAWHCSAMPY